MSTIAICPTCGSKSRIKEKEGEFDFRKSKKIGLFFPNLEKTINYSLLLKLLS